MLHFPELRMRRLIVQLRELTIGQAIKVASMPSHLEESSCTAFLRYATESVKVNATGSLQTPPNNINDPASWTVQERMMAVCHYLASTSEDGADFRVGTDGNYTDYLDAEITGSVAPIDIGVIGDDNWEIGHLTGGMAETVERLYGDIEGISKKLHWIVGCMACQLTRKGELAASPDGADFDKFVLDRMKIILEFPENDFVTLMLSYLAGREKLHHLFIVDFSDDGGMVAMPVRRKEIEGGEAIDLPPARFPVRPCLSRVAHDLAERFD